MVRESSSGRGRLYGVGVGPGDPELLTIKAHRILQRVPVVAVPKRGPRAESYAYGIVKGFLAPERQEVLELLFPMTKDRAQLAASWEQAVATVQERLEEGKDVAFVTEGDPFLYSTFVYVWQLLRQRCPAVAVEVVPGVSSLNAAAAAAGLPLADGDDRVAVLPATYEGDRLAEDLGRFDTVVLLKVGSAIDRVLDVLEGLGLVEKAVCVTRCTSPEQEIVRDVRTLRGKKLDYFSLMIVRKS